MAQDPLTLYDTDLSNLIQTQFTLMKQRSLQHIIAQVVRQRIIDEVDSVLKAHAIDIKSIVEAEVLLAASQMAKPP